MVKRCQKTFSPLLLIVAACAAGQKQCPDDDKTVPSILVAAAQGTVSVMTFNIFHDDGNKDKQIPKWDDGRKQIVVDVIKHENPDIVGLQEAFMSQVSFLVGRFPEYSFVGRGREDDDGGESVSILFKKDMFTLLDSGHFWFSGHPDDDGTKGGDSWGNMSTPRMTTWVRLKKKDTDNAFYVFNTHLSSDGTATDANTARLKSAILLAERIAARAHPQEHFLVTGDFNAEVDERPLKYLLGTASSCTGMACPVPPPMTPIKFFDVWDALNDGQGGTKCDNTSSSDGERIDHIFAWNPAGAGLCASNCSPPQVLEARAIPPLPTCASDHRAVFAKVTLPLVVVSQ